MADGDFILHLEQCVKTDFEILSKVKLRKERLTAFADCNTVYVMSKCSRLFGTSHYWRKVFSFTSITLTIRSRSVNLQVPISFADGIDQGEILAF